MDLLRNFISQFQKSLQKTENDSNNKTSHSIKDIPLMKPVDITNDVLNNGNVEVNMTQEINSWNDIETRKNFGKEILTNAVREKPKENDPKTNLNKQSSEDFSETTSNIVFLEKLLNNTSMSITKVKIEDQTVNAEKLNCIQEKGQYVNNNIEKKDCSDSTLDLESIDNTPNETSSPKHNNPLKSNIETADAQNLVTAHSTVSKGLNNTKIENIKDHTQKCLQEFDDILAEVQRKDSKVDTEGLSLDDIDDILKEELVVDSIYNFQEIQYTNVDVHDSTIAYNCNNIVIRLDKDIIITKLQNTYETANANDVDIISISSDDSHNMNEILNHTKAQNETKGNKIDIISLSSDDSSNTTNSSKDTHLEDTGRNTKENDKNTQFNIPNIIQNTDICDKEIKLEQTKEERILETVSINSEPKSDTEDDCGYHSSDFEFISEAEAKMDGFIINFNPDRYYNNKKHDKNTNNRFGPGPSSKNVGKCINYKGHKKVVDNSYMENYAVPEESAFLNMFRGAIPNMPTCEIHFLENKSVRTRAPMLVQYEGVGFDMNLALRRADSSDDEYREEAEENLKKILQMYPNENIKRKRRRRF